MCEYALIMLNICEYASIYLNKQSYEYDKILILSDAVHSIRSMYKLLSIIETYAYWEHYQAFKVERFAKRIIAECVEYASKSLNVPKYPSKCLNKLSWLCQSSQYTSSY